MMNETGTSKAPWKNRIGVKIFGLLSLVIILAVLPFAYVVLVTVNSFGTYSATINEEQITQQSFDYLKRLSQEQGQKYEEYFNRVHTAATLMSLQASKLYDTLQATEIMPDFELIFERQAENDMFLTPLGSDIITLFWGGDELTHSALLELQALRRLDPLLKKVKKLLPASQATHIITTTGIGVYYAESERAREAVRHLPMASEFDLRDGEPLTIFTKNNRATDTAQWTGIYKDDVIDGLMVTASGPIVDQNGIFRGIIGIDLPLQKIVDDVHVKKGDSAQLNKQISFSFLVDSRGQIIAFPADHLASFGFDIDLSQLKNSADIINFNLKNSTIEGVRNLTTSFLNDSNSLVELVLEGQKHYIATQNMPTLGWTFAFVVKHADLTSSVEKTQEALRGTLKDLMSGFLLNSLAICSFALVLVFLAVRYFVGPLQKLAEIAQNVGKGNLAVSCVIDRKDELGLLGKAMNEMITQLSVADDLKVNYSTRLEKDIEERTKDLEIKNISLEKAVNDLHLESESRRKVTRALQESEKQLRSIMTSSLTSLCIVQNDTFRYVNNAIATMFGYSQRELLNGPSPIDLVLPRYQKETRFAIKKLSDGEQLKRSWPYHIQCRRCDGTIFDAQVEAAQIIWEGRSAIVVTLIDISPLKKTEHKLLVKEKRLQDSLEEKNILLREVYHRTKNNMLVIISMLNLQLDGIEDEKAIRIFTETEHRIRAMALVHENLYRSKNLAAINLGEYLKNMVETLVKSMTLGGGVRVTSRYCFASISFEQAIPVGLIVNELVTNSVKHGFNAGDEGEIRLEINKISDGYELIVADNGIGLPENIDPHTSKSFGMQITTNMIEKQLGATFEVDCSSGTQYKIKMAILGEGEADER